MRFAGELGKEVLYGLLVVEAAFFQFERRRKLRCSL